MTSTLDRLFETLPWGPAPESAAVAQRWLDAHKRRFGLFIGGRWLKGSGGARVPTLNPSTTEPLALVVQAGKKDVAGLPARRSALNAS